VLLSSDETGMDVDGFMYYTVYCLLVSYADHRKLWGRQEFFVMVIYWGHRVHMLTIIMMQNNKFLL
jgi:hypothetical protein